MELDTLKGFIGAAHSLGGISLKSVLAPTMISELLQSRNVGGRVDGGRRPPPEISER